MNIMRRGWFRASASDEVEGLDSRYHASTRKLNPQVGPTAGYGQSNQRLRRTLDTMENSHESATSDVQQSIENTENLPVNQAEEIPSKATSIVSGGW